MSDEVNKSSLFDLVKLKELGGFKAGELLSVDPNLYDKFQQHIGKTVKRDVVTRNMVLLTGISAYTQEPINLFLRGESSIGKTYNVTEVLRYFPKEDVWLLGGLSPTALVHDYGTLIDKNGNIILPYEKPGKDAAKEELEAWYERIKGSRYLVELSGKILVFLEAPNIETFNKLRPILSHDAFEVSYKFAEKSKKGQIQTTHVVIRGWPATIFCSTQERYVQDLATRAFTITPETTEDKFRDANILTAEKASYPWKFGRDFDFMLLEGYVRFLRNNLKEVKVVIPYADASAKQFPSKFPRSMRDFQHVLSLMKVSALFHLYQRPVLIRKYREEVQGKEPDVPEYKDVEEQYIMATRQDFDFIMALWNEIREQTETSAPGHIIRFYHDVVLKVAETKEDFVIEDLVDKWNSEFEEKKSSHTIRKWVDFLCDIGYVTKKSNPNDKRSNILSIIRQKNGNYGGFNFSVIFGLDSFKAWLNEANQILEKNQILLRENLISNTEVSIEDIFDKYFLSKNGKISNISLSDSKASLDETTSEITENQEAPQFPLFSVKDVRELVRLTTLFEDRCQVCGKTGRMDWQATLHDGTWGLLCGDCGLRLSKELGKIE
jgi:hypothetical protein